MTKQQTNLLKGLAIVMIILFHIQSDLFSFAFIAERGTGLSAWFAKAGSYLSTVNWSWLGLIPAVMYIGVHVFFILSGYGLTKKYYEMEHFSYRSWLKQIWKLYWPYLIALPVTLLINLGLSYVLLAAGRIDSVPPVFGIYLPSQYLESILLPSRWFNDRLAFNFVGTWWFVGVLLQFYLLLPLLMWLLKKLKPWRFIILALLVTLVYRFWAAYATNSSPIGIAYSDPLQFINFPARLAEFALGMFLATRTSLRFFKHQSLAGIGLILAGILMAPYVWGIAINDVLIGLGWALLMPLLAEFLGMLRKPARLLEWAGERSYGLFLYQEPALRLILILIFGNLPV